MNNEKMIKTAGTMYKIVNVLEKILIAGVILIAAGCGIILIVGIENIPVTVTTLSFGNTTLYLRDGVIPVNTITVPEVLVTMAAAAVMVAVVLYMFRILKQILKPMKEGRPFDTSVSEGIRRLGWAVLAEGVIRYVTEILTARITMGNYEILKNLFREGTVDHIRIQASFSLGFVFMAFLLFLLSYIFRYGEELQRQSDETL